MLLYKKNIRVNTYKEWPKVPDRKDLILKAHLVGHFQASSTYTRLAEKYYWKGMFDDVSNIVKQCITCQRHHKVPSLNHMANTKVITGIFDQIGMDLALGLPITKDGSSRGVVSTHLHACNYCKLQLKYCNYNYCINASELRRP